MNDDGVVSIEDAARECGMTLDELFSQMVIDGLLLPVGDDEYLPTGSPFLVWRKEQR